MAILSKLAYGGVQYMTEPRSIDGQGEMETQIRELAESTASHAALNNEFYRLWQAQPLAADQVALVAVNFHARIVSTPDRIAWAVVRMIDPVARAETAENLNDELGHGNIARSHAPMVRQFFSALLSRMRGREVPFDQLTAPVLAATRSLNEQAITLFGSEYPEQVAGALLAQEWHAYTQLVYLYEGARNYMKYFHSLDEFHEHCEYFYVHIGTAEKEHKVHSVSSASRICRTQEQLHRLEYGFTRYLDLLTAYWQDLYMAVQDKAPASV